MEFLQKLKISGGVNLSNIRLSRDNERPSTGPNSPTKQRNEPKDDESLPPRGSPAAKKMKILLVIDSPDTDWWEELGLTVKSLILRRCCDNVIFFTERVKILDNCTNKMRIKDHYS